jgi:hypothetical protein
LLISLQKEVAELKRQNELLKMQSNTSKKSSRMETQKESTQNSNLTASQKVSLLVVSNFDI